MRRLIKGTDVISKLIQLLIYNSWSIFSNTVKATVVDILLIGSWSIHDGDGNENGKKAIGLD